MTLAGQVRFDGRVVTVVKAEIPGFGKVSLELPDDTSSKLQTGDRIVLDSPEFVVVKESYGEKHNKDGYGTDDPELVYVTQAIRPVTIKGVKRKADIDQAWEARVAAAAQ